MVKLIWPLPEKCTSDNYFLSKKVSLLFRDEGHFSLMVKRIVNGEFFGSCRPFYSYNLKMRKIMLKIKEPLYRISTTGSGGASQNFF